MKQSGSPFCPAATTSASGSFCQGHVVPADSCLTSMPHSRANPKQPSFHRKPGNPPPPHPSPCTMHCSRAEGACRVTWGLPTRLNAKRQNGVTKVCRERESRHANMTNTREGRDRSDREEEIKSHTEKLKSQVYIKCK